ncbi:CGNR zinc finger domain-containing protein [Salinisphaera aquimarina]|uniref:CGNR zinc finger domain-containing protein n=1 Tax=Salinisphaera aquimarina TaxID=2094031 RepID=A0ABV7EU92_9GAMM
MSTQVSDRPFVFLAGLTWLDFLNTELMEGDSAVDLLGSTGDLAAWAEQANLCEIHGSAGRDAERNGDTHALNQARSFRHELRKQAERFAAGHSAGQTFVQLLNDQLATGVWRPTVRETGQDFDLRFELTGRIDVEAVLSLVAESAARYLANGKAGRLKSCEHSGCILFFYDTSKNNARRWCSMATCGNRAKAKAHYARKRHPPSA